MMNNCKLFDEAAFGKTLYSQKMSVKHNVSTLSKNLRSCLRTSVFLDASDCYESWVVYNKKNALRYKTINEMHIANAMGDLTACRSPWRNVFIYCGKDSDTEAGTGITIDLGVLVSCVADDINEAVCAVILRNYLPVKGKIFIEPFRLRWNQDGSFDSPLFMGDDDECKFDLYLFSLAPFVFQLMHCRNIITQKHEPYRPQMPKGKRNKSPKITYHTLRISNTLIKREDDQQSGESCERAKHICRGNFAHYTKEKPLFGKYTGMFWRPMHIKGSAKHGIVGKEYEIK